MFAMDLSISEVFETRRENKCVTINNFKFRKNKNKSKGFRCYKSPLNIVTVNIFDIIITVISIEITVLSIYK